MTNNPNTFLDNFLDKNKGKHLGFLYTTLEDDDFAQSIRIYEIEEDGLFEKFDSWDFEDLRDFNSNNYLHSFQVALRLKDLGFNHIYYISNSKIFLPILNSSDIQTNFSWDYDEEGNIVPVGYYVNEPISFAKSPFHTALRKHQIKLESILKNIK